MAQLLCALCHSRHRRRRRRRCAQVLAQDDRKTRSNLQELISTAEMVQSHMAGGMSARALAAWLQASCCPPAGPPARLPKRPKTRA